MAQLDERGKELTDTIEVCAKDARENLETASALLDVDNMNVDLTEAVSLIREALQDAERAERAQDRLDNL